MALTSSRKLWCSWISCMLLCCAAAVHAPAQPAGKRQADSLLQVARTLADNEPLEVYPTIEAGYEAAVRLHDTPLAHDFKILAAYYFSQAGRLDTAALLLKQSEAFLQAGNARQHSPLHGLWHLYSGFWHFRQKDFDASRERYTAALQFFRETTDRRYESVAQSHLGALNLVLLDHPKALEHFMEAYHMKLELGLPPRSLMYELQHIANIYHRMGLSEKALGYARSGLLLARRSGEAEAEADFLLLMGAAHQKLGNSDSAFLLYDQAYDLARATHLNPQAYMARYYTADAHATLGRYELSKQLTREIQQDPAFGSLGVDAGIGYLLSKNYLHTAQYDSSIYYGAPAFRQAKEKNDITAMSLLANVLSEAYEQKKDIKNALVYRRAYHAVQDTLFNQAQQTQFNELHARLETMEQEKQKIEMEKKAESDKLVAKIWLFASAAAVVVSVLSLLIVRGWYKNEVKRKQLKELELKSEIDFGQSELYKQTLHMIHFNNNLEQLEAELKKIKAGMPGNEGIDSIISTIHTTKSLDKEWEKFDNYFARVHFSFYEGMLTKYPQLSDHEVRICSLLKLGLSNKEIATIMGIEQTSIRMAKYRLKKKLGLREDENVDDFLLSAGKVENRESGWQGASV